MLRVVVDTNVFVSALLSRSGSPAQVVQAWKDRKFVMITSAAIIEEIAEVLSGFVGRKPYQVTQEDVEDILRLLWSDAFVVTGSADVSDAGIADSDDLIFLACAVNGEADVLVSGDKHLRSMEKYHCFEALAYSSYT